MARTTRLATDRWILPAVWLAVLLALPVGCASVPRAPDDGGPTWMRADSGHLFVETDLGDAGARELAHDLEAWRLAMTAALFRHARAPAERLDVIALRIGELASLHYTLIGAFGRPSRDDPPTLVLGPAQPDERIEIMRHELAHAVVAENLHDVPQWLNEGLASLLATAEVDERTGTISWGRLEIRGAHIYHHDLAPLDALLSGDWPAFDGARYEFSAAYLVRTLAIGHPRELECLLERLTGTDGYDAALAACFPDRTAWAAEYGREQFREDQIAGRIKVGSPDPAGAVVVRPMSNAEVHAALARLHDVVASTMPQHDERRLELKLEADRQRARARALGAPATSTER
jgi:hypothetical protein